MNSRPVEIGGSGPSLNKIMQVVNEVLIISRLGTNCRPVEIGCSVSSLNKIMQHIHTHTHTHTHTQVAKYI